MTMIDWLSDVCRFVWSRERSGFASKSEMRRWCRDGAVKVNREGLRELDEVPFPVTSLVLFPKSPKKVTIL